MTRKNVIAAILALASLSCAVWAMVLLIVMVAHAVSTFITALLLLAGAAILGWIALIVAGTDLFGRFINWSEKRTAKLR